MMSDLKPSMGVLVVTETSIQEKLIPPFFLPPLSLPVTKTIISISKNSCVSQDLQSPLWFFIMIMSIVITFPPFSLLRIASPHRSSHAISTACHLNSS